MSKLKFHNGLAWEALDAANGDSVNGISFRINGGKLQYSTNGTTWSDAGADTSDATALAGDILSGKTAYVNGIKITGTIPSKGAQTFTPGTSNQTIAANQFLSGIQTISGDASLTAANIRQGASVFGVAGTFSYTTAGATAAQIQTGRVAFVNGVQVTGTAPTKTAQTFTPGTTNQTIASGQILTGVQTISGSANLTAANIKKDVNIFGVVGTLPSPTLSQEMAWERELTGLTTNKFSITADNDFVYIFQTISSNTYLTKHRVSDLVEVARSASLGNLGGSVCRVLSDSTHIFMINGATLRKYAKSNLALSASVACDIPYGISTDGTYIYTVSSSRVRSHLMSTLVASQNFSFAIAQSGYESCNNRADTSKIYVVTNDTRIFSLNIPTISNSTSTSVATAPRFVDVTDTHVFVRSASIGTCMNKSTLSTQYTIALGSSTSDVVTCDETYGYMTHADTRQTYKLGTTMTVVGRAAGYEFGYGAATNDTSVFGLEYAKLTKYNKFIYT